MTENEAEELAMARERAEDAERLLRAARKTLDAVAREVDFAGWADAEDYGARLLARVRERLETQREVAAAVQRHQAAVLRGEPSAPADVALIEAGMAPLRARFAAAREVRRG